MIGSTRPGAVLREYKSVVPERPLAVAKAEPWAGATLPRHPCSGGPLFDGHMRSIRPRPQILSCSFCRASRYCVIGGIAIYNRPLNDGRALTAWSLFLAKSGPSIHSRADSNGQSPQKCRGDCRLSPLDRVQGYACHRQRAVFQPLIATAQPSLHLGNLSKRIHHQFCRQVFPSDGLLERWSTRE